MLLKPKILRFIAAILILTGIVIIGGTYLTKIYYEKKNEKMTVEMEAKMAYLASVSKDNLDEEVEKIESELADDEVVGLGILSIPALDVKVTVVEGIDSQALKYTIGHFEDTAYPGECGNFCVAGHSSIYYNMVFSELHSIEMGESIFVKTLTNTYEYVITDKYKVEPTDLTVLNQTDDATLTIVTCSDDDKDGHGERRLIVKAKLKP